MNIISNDCVGGRIYNELNIQYQNPFIWTCITTKDFLYIVNNYSSINFFNYKCLFSNYSFNDNHNYPIIIVDNKITLHFVHYKYDKNCDKITKTSSYEYSLDISYNQILKYTEDVYLRRIKRMKNKIPIFIYNPSIPQFINKSSDDVFNNFDNYKLILCTNNKYQQINNHIIYNYHFEKNSNFELTQNIAKNIIKENLL